MKHQTLAAAGLAGTIAGYAELQWLGRTYGAFYLAVIVPADFVMSRQMLHGVKQRAERTTSDHIAALARGNGRRQAPAFPE